jgi:predicted ArsR family transcriptional regulator
LAQPTRAHLFRVLEALKRPATTSELADRLDLHPNGVRLHLERMESAGLVTRSRAALPRGRPRDEWSIAPRVTPGGDPPRAYGDLAQWLTRIVAGQPEQLADVERSGRDIGRELAPKGSGSPVAQFESALSALGFHPEVEPSAAGLHCVLHNCPYREAVREDRDVICGLHRGLTRGLLDVICPTAKLEAFVPRDPDKAGCRIEVEGLAA